MRTFSKIVLTFVIFMIGGVIIAALNRAQGTSSGGGPIGVLITVGLMFGIFAIWKWKPDNDDNDSKLDKN